MIIGNKIYKKERCYNSLQWAKDEIESAPDGSVFIANIHEYTRGRQNRKWHTYPGQLLVTILLKPKERINNQLNMALSLGILKTLKQYNVTLKWPNDFIFKGKKLGGMITKVIWSDNNPLGIIVGFALNVNTTFDQSDKLFEIATSLKTMLGKEIDQEQLFIQLLTSIDEYYKLWLHKKFEQIFTEYRKNQGYLNKKITIHKNSGSLVSGLFLDILENGNIILKHKNGYLEEIDFTIVENFK
jgi:BirA family biotin operon repressor/biotin-[acetyl-CoA-carboxylase] ligase